MTGEKQRTDGGATFPFRCLKSTVQSQKAPLDLAAHTANKGSEISSGGWKRSAEMRASRPASHQVEFKSRRQPFSSQLKASLGRKMKWGGGKAARDVCKLDRRPKPTSSQAASSDRGRNHTLHEAPLCR